MATLRQPGLVGNMGRPSEPKSFEVSPEENQKVAVGDPVSPSPLQFVAKLGCNQRTWPEKSKS